MEGKSEISAFFKDQTIFVTGGTGFLGKLLIEKLLRSCYHLRKIYILVREKKGVQEEERFQEIFKQPCFDPLKRSNPDFFEKVQLINGDCVKPYLGISESDRKMLIDEVSTVFHVAATVRFDQHLKTASYINVRATKDLLQMAKEMTHLKSFVHVSTVFSNCNRLEIEEKFYQPPISGEKLLQLIDVLDDDTLKDITPSLLGDWPNTYVFTKAVAENIVNTFGEELPVAVVRPAIVTPTYNEPIPGWIDNVYGSIGVTMFAALGIIRTMPADPDSNAENVPADLVVNNIIAAAWDVGKKSSNETHDIPIYNFVSQVVNPLSWSQYKEITYVEAHRYPTDKVVWHYCFELRPNPIQHKIAVFLLHMIPAYVADFVLKIIGKKPVAVEGYVRLNKFLEVIAFFAKRKFRFNDKNVQELYKNLPPVDQKLFNFDIGTIDHRTSISRSCQGMVRYLMKEEITDLSIKKGLRKLRYLKIIHYVVVALLWFLMYKFVKILFKLVFQSYF